MVRANQICRHPQRAKIDRAIQNGSSSRIIADQFDISNSAVRRYITKGCPDGDLSPKEAIQKAVSEGNLNRGLSGIKILTDAYDLLEEIARDAKRDGSYSAAATAARGMIDVAKVLGVEKGATGKGSALIAALDKLGAGVWDEAEVKAGGEDATNRI